MADRHEDDLTVVYMWARKEAEGEIKALRAKVERLRELSAEMATRCIEKDREKERLREALRSIACTDADCSCVKSFGSPTEHCVYGQARAALGEGA